MFYKFAFVKAFYASIHFYGSVFDVNIRFYKSILVFTFLFRPIVLPSPILSGLQSFPARTRVLPYKDCSPPLLGLREDYIVNELFKARRRIFSLSSSLSDYYFYEKRIRARPLRIKRERVPYT